MSETKVILNSANDLLLLGDAIRSVPLKDIAQASLKGLRRQESDLDLYAFLFTDAIHLFEPQEFELEISCTILPELVCFLEKIQSELQSNALSFFFVENLTILLKLADVLQKLVEYLAEKAEQCQLLRSIVIFPEYLLRCYTIVRKNYVTMAQEAEGLEAMKSLYAACKKLLVAFLELLYPREACPGRGSYFRAMDHDEEYDYLQKVCTLLASVANEISPIDSLLASDVWKTVVKLCTEHVDQLIARRRTACIGEIVTILNSGINASFSDLRTKNEPTKQSTITLKLNAFFLRVVLKLLSLVKQHIDVGVYTPIISAVLEVKACLHGQTLCTELAAGVEQYLHIGYMAIVENSFRSEAFAKAFSQYECRTVQEIHSYYTLTMHIVTQIVTNANDNALLSLYCIRVNLLQRVCVLLKRSDSLLFENPSLYKQLVVHCSALVLIGVRLKDRAAQKTIEETLVRMILHEEHCHTALLGIDLWSVFVRYHSPKLMHSYLLFWKAVNDRYSIFTTRPTQVYVRQLLRNLFVFLPVAHKERLLDAFPIGDGKNDRLWAAVGPLPNEIDEGRRRQFTAGLEKRLIQCVKTLQLTPGNVKVFYETLGLFSIAGATTKLVDPSVKSFWNAQLNWDAIMKTTPTSCIFDCLERSATVSSANSMLSIKNASSIGDARPYIKYQVGKLLLKADSLTDVSNWLEVLLRDKSAFVKAFSFHLLSNLKDNHTPSVVQLLNKQPHLQSQLARWHSNASVKLSTIKPRANGTITSVAHRCARKVDHTRDVQSTGDLTQAINNQIDELFPDDDDDLDDVDMFADNSSQTKKRKFEPTSSEQREGEGEVPVTKCLRGLQSATDQLERLVPSANHRLQSSQKGQLKRIISALTKVLDS
ncbi:uncharacterized protein LOC121591939 [Anopheles merus]|uniref:Uncharacterized protein n=1 Tax=Anopheles merus TaxID=30066 RepID=A0A182UND3_ANOME|nr:uncharacterized protein LOC121591939 [Anopheles merus]